MLCEKCRGKLGAYNTTDFGSCVARQRICRECGAIFYTLEEFIDDEEGHDLVAEKRKRSSVMKGFGK